MRIHVGNEAKRSLFPSQEKFFRELRAHETTWYPIRPRFLAVSPPKSSWGHSRPSRRKRDRVLAADRSRNIHFVMQSVVHHE